jgi:wyosine [tRNA(Phe)-imidazoG37] synthetase (radical SAM superfamily)
MTETYFACEGLAKDEVLDIDNPKSGEVLNEMISTIIKENEGIGSQLVIEMLGEYYETDEETIRDLLKKINSDFVKNNQIIGFIDGKPLRRTTHHCRMFSIFKGIAVKLTNRGLDCETEEDICRVMETVQQAYGGST